MSELLYENIILMKMLIDKKDEISSIKLTLPKISPDLNVTIFEAIMLLFSLTSYKHHIKGEIIAIPTQVLSVLDYLHNTDGGDEYLVNSFGFDFNLFLPDNLEGQELIFRLKELLGEEDEDAPTKLISYINQLTIDASLPNSEKIRLINEIYENIKGLSKYIQFKMSETKDRKTYETLKEFYYAAFYAKEVKDIYTVMENEPEHKRTAKTYVEFLYFNYPSLYYSIFTPNFAVQYQEYISENNIDASDYSLDNFMEDILNGDYGTDDSKIRNFTFANLNTNNENNTVTDDLIYYYIDHIISRLETIVADLKYLYMQNDSSTPIEDLLLKMIRYFKSFTVDCLGLDIIYIYDMKSENIIRFFDEIYEIIKLIEPHEFIHLSYGDIIKYIKANIHLDDKTINLYDKLICDMIDIRLTEFENSTMFYDKIKYIKKDIQADEHNKIYDVMGNIINNSVIYDKTSNINFGDKINKMWYD